MADQIKEYEMNEKILVNILQKAQPFKYLDEKTIYAILNCGQLITFSHSTPILYQGKQGKGLYIILKGKTSVTVKVLSEGVIKLACLMPGQFFGEVNLLEHTCCTATVTSIANTLCFLFEKECFDAYYFLFPKHHYDISRALIETVLVRHDLLIERIKELFKNAPTIKALSGKKKNKSIKPVRLKSTAKKEKFAYLKALPIFENFNEEELEIFLNATAVFKASAQVDIIKKGKLNNACFFILNGAIEVSVLYEKFEEKFAVLGPNNFFGSTSLVDKQPEKFNYTTYEESILLEITSKKLDFIINQHPFLWYKVYNLLGQHMLLLQEKLNNQVVRLVAEDRIMLI
jgi:CRP-like cAMP-binding protein